MSYVNTLRHIPLITDVQEICFTKQLWETIDPAYRAKARNNSKRVFAYRIVYTSRNHKVVGFIVEPKRGQLVLPCIIWNRGGSKDFGAIQHRQLFGRMANLASLGYIVIASQYSGNDRSDGVDQMGGEDIQDVLNFYKILRAYKRADAKRIGMYGWSRGGMMTYLALSKVKWIKAAVVGGAPTDQIRAATFRPGWEKHQKEMYGGSRRENIKRSALYWSDKLYKKAPILIMHGTADWRVNPLDSIRLAEQLYENQVPFRVVIFEGGDHGLTEFEDEADRLMEQWFAKYLTDTHKLPNLKPHGK